MAIYNSIFGEYRENQKRIDNAINLLQKNEYVVLSKADYTLINNALNNCTNE